MTVKKLIAELKKMPPDMQVFWADHDHNDYEINAMARRVWLVDKADAKESYAQTLKEMENETPNKYVVIRP